MLITNCLSSWRIKIVINPGRDKFITIYRTNVPVWHTNSFSHISQEHNLKSYSPHNNVKAKRWKKHWSVTSFMTPSQLSTMVNELLRAKNDSGAPCSPKNFISLHRPTVKKIPARLIITLFFYILHNWSLTLCLQNCLSSQCEVQARNCVQGQLKAHAQWTVYCHIFSC